MKTIKIGVVSDTHLTQRNPWFEQIIEQHFNDVDMVFHAGDLISLDVLAAFGDREVLAVRGNMDPQSLCTVLPEKQVVEVNNHRIGLIHGWGSPFGMEEKLLGEFEDVHCIVYGHTHRPVNTVIDDILFFNPGSPTDRRFAPLNTVGILEVGDIIRGCIVEIK